MNIYSYTCCNSTSKEHQKMVSTASLLKILGVENRIKILCVLNSNPHCVCELEEHFDMSQSLISHHLADLKSVGLVVSKKEGINVYYRLTKKGQTVFNFISNFSKEI